MNITSHQQIDGLDERRFLLNDVRGILWTPPSAPKPLPLVIAGQPGGKAGIDDTRPRLLERARHAAAVGLATATIELPGSGDRPALPEVDAARVKLRRALSNGDEVSADLIDQLVLPLVDAAVPESTAALDALLELDELSGRVGLSGGVISIGTRLAASDPRISAAVLFAGSLVPRAIVQDARRVTIPVHLLLQWDDEGNDRRQALELFDAFGSAQKTLSANTGGHLGVPPYAGQEALRFLCRHLVPAAG